MKYKIMITISVLAFILLSASMTYSFFSSDTTLNNVDERIASFIFNAETLEKLEIPLVDLIPGHSEEYEFSIGNTSENKTSDVTIQYQLTIETPHLTPLIIELYKSDELVMSCDETYSRNDNNELVCNTEIQELIHSETNLDNYKLKVTFDEQYNDETYSNLIDYINIQIKSYQKI